MHPPPPASPQRAAAPVAWRRAACLRTRLHGSSCQACEQACPASCLRAAEGGVSLAAGCTGCGRCRAACPTGALTVTGFDLGADLAPPHAVHWVVACARAPSQANQLRVPCLGGLSVADLLWLCAQAPQHTVLLRDEGGCLGCDSGGELDPAQALLEQARALMSEVGVPPERLPRRVSTSDARRGRSEDPMQSAGRARRGFFAALARPQPAAAKQQPAAKAPSAVRERLLQSLDALARRHGGALPASLFPSLEAAPSCGGHRVCAAVCPTGALVRYRDDRAGRNGIAFAARDCIACGHCVAACPEKALRLQPGAGSADAGRRPLTSFVQRECADCGARFASAPQDPARRCPRCRRSAALASAAFNTLFVPTFHEEAR